MKRSYLSLLLALSIALTGCMTQKRSIMRGWHFELRQNAPQTITSELAEIDLKEGTLRPSKDSEKTAQINRADPFVPLKSLMTYSVPIEIAQKPHLAPKIQKSNPFVFSASALELGATADSKSYWFNRFWEFSMSLIWLNLGGFGFAVGGGYILVGLACVFIAYRNLAWAFASKNDWTIRKASKLGNRTFFPSSSKFSARKNRLSSSSQGKTETNTSRSAQSAQNENLQRARLEKIQREQAKKQRIRAEKKQARKAHFQDFISAPTTRIAIGFIAIMCGYLAFF
jgi:hypothetical protein